MKIYDRDIAGTGAAEGGRVAEAQRAERQTRLGAAGSSDGGDRVELSHSLERLAQAVSAYEAERAGRVESLTALYAAGGYRPDAAAISHAMVPEGLSAGRET